MYSSLKFCDPLVKKYMSPYANFYTHFSQLCTEIKLNSIKLQTTDLRIHGESDSLCFLFVQQIFHELWVLIYDVVEIKLMVPMSSSITLIPTPVYSFVTVEGIGF